MNLSKTFANIDIVKERFGKKFDASKNIKMTNSIVVAPSIVEIANKSGYEVVYDDLYIYGYSYLEGYVENKKIVIDNYGTQSRQRYITALFLSRSLHPELSEPDHMRFADKILFPEESLRLAISEYFENNPSENENTKLSSDLAQHLADIFITNPKAIEIRLRQLDLLCA